MKKAIIAGATSAVLAAMPVMGVFAATGDGATTGSSQYTDNLSVKIDTACTFAREAYTSGGLENNASHKNGQGTWATDTLSATLTNSSLSTLGSSNFKIVCNNTAGHQIVVTTTGLTSGDNSIPNNTTYTNAISGWSPVYEGTKLTNNSVVISENTTTDNTTFEVSYGIGISSTQQAGTYTGTAVYTFSQL